VGGAVSEPAAEPEPYLTASVSASLSHSPRPALLDDYEAAAHVLESLNKEQLVSFVWTVASWYSRAVNYDPVEVSGPRRRARRPSRGSRLRPPAPEARSRRDVMREGERASAGTDGQTSLVLPSKRHVLATHSCSHANEHYAIRTYRVATTVALALSTCMRADGGSASP
jgi:hypothetical protein